MFSGYGWNIASIVLTFVFYSFQKRRQMYFKGAKIHVREAYRDVGIYHLSPGIFTIYFYIVFLTNQDFLVIYLQKQQGRGDFQRQTSGGGQQMSQHAGGDHRGFDYNRDAGYSRGDGGYDRGYSGGSGDSDNKNPFLQSPIFSGSAGSTRSNVGSGMMSDNRSASQYGGGNMGSSQGWSRRITKSNIYS